MLAPYRILETPPEPPYDDIAALAADLFDAPLAALAFADAARLWLKAAVGWPAREWPAVPGLGLTAQEDGDVTVVADTRAEPACAAHPLVLSGTVGFSVAVPLRDEHGRKLGTLGVMGPQPRAVEPRQVARLQQLARVAEQLLRQRRDQLRLQRREQERQALAEVLPHLVWTARPDGAIESFSRDYLAVIGADAEVESQDWQRYLHPDDRQHAGRAWAAAVASGAPFRVEYRLWYAPRDEYRWHLVQAQPARDPQGRISRWYGTSVDIHDRKLAEERLQRSEERLRTVVETQPESVKLVSADGLLLEANGAALRWMGVERREAVLGEPLADFVHPEDRPAFEAFLHSALEGRGRHASVRMLSRVGSQRWMESRAAPLHQADGSTALLVVARDITQRRLTEAALAEAQKRTALILASTGEGIYGVDAGGRLNFINASALRMLGFSEDELLGQDTQAVFHQPPAGGAGNAGERRPVALTLRDGVSRQVDSEFFRRKRGHPFPVEYTVSAVHGERGEVAGAVVSFRDVSLKKRNSELRVLEARVLDLVSSGRALPAILEEITRTVDRLLPDVRSSVHLVDGERLAAGAPPHLPAGDDLRACRSTPVLAADGSVLATFAIHYREPRAPADEEEFIVRVGQYVRVAIERTREQEALQRSERRYRSLHDLVPVAILEQDWSGVLARLQALREEGVEDWRDHFLRHPRVALALLQAIRTSGVNRAALAMFEAASLDELQRNFDRLLDCPSAHAGVAALLAGVAARPRGFETELDLRTLRGRTLRVWLTLTVRDPAEGGGRVLVSMLDVTARKEAEERFRTVAQSTSDVVWDWNLRESTIWWSDGFPAVFGREHRAGTRPIASWTDHIHPDDRDRVLADVDRALAAGAQHWKAEYRFARGDGAWAEVIDQGTVLRDDAGQPLRIVGSLIDVTERRQLQDQLRQAQRLDAVGQLTGGVAHDFNNLLTVILGNAELLMEDLAGQPAQRRLAELVASAAERGAELASRLLAFARRQPLDPKAVDLGCQLAGMGEMLRRTLGEHVQIEMLHAPGLWPALTDPGQLENAILNLCLNARDAMPAGGKLTLETANVRLAPAQPPQPDEVEPGEYVLVSVSDSGTGMDEATRERAFEPFFTTKETGKGSGLGLSMVYGFAKQSRGHVRIYSEPGHGTTVRLYLPRAADGQPAAAQAPAPAADLPRGTEHVLLVEDNELVRDHVAGQLDRLGYRVTAVADGPEALAALQPPARFDLLFTDVVMPGGLSGPQLAEEARRRQPGLPVLYTSGYTETAMVRHGRLEPGVHLLPKPYRKEDLAAKLRQVLGGTGLP